MRHLVLPVVLLGGVVLLAGPCGHLAETFVPGYGKEIYLIVGVVTATVMVLGSASCASYLQVGDQAQPNAQNPAAVVAHRGARRRVPGRTVHGDLSVAFLSTDPKTAMSMAMLDARLCD